MHRNYMQKKRADEIQMVEIQAEKEKRADEIQIAKIEADKELTLKEMELKAQVQTNAVEIHLLVIEMLSFRLYRRKV